MGFRTETTIINQRNPAWTPTNGEPEMLTPKVIETQVQTTPKILSASAFQDYCVLTLGGGNAGMARFVEIMEDAEASNNKQVRFAYKRYDKSTTFEKNNTASFTQLLTDAAIMKDGERTAILSNWPEN